ncbi:10979_t:CDS:2, partial [Scutellospora calospora]
LKGYIRILEANLAEDNNQDSKKDSQQLTKIMLTNDEWNLLRNLIPVLGPFEEITRYLSGSNYATYSIMSPLLTIILKMLKPASLTNETNEINIEKIEDIFIDEIQELLKNKYYDMKNNSKVNSTTASTSTTSTQNLSNICSFPNSTLTMLYKPILFNIFNNLPTVNSQSELDEYFDHY